MPNPANLRETERRGEPRQTSSLAMINMGNGVHNRATKVIKPRATRLTPIRKLVLQTFLNDAYAEPWKIVSFTGNSWMYELIHRFKSNSKCRAEEISINDIIRWMRYPTFAWQFQEILQKGILKYLNFLKSRRAACNGQNDDQNLHALELTHPSTSRTRNNSVAESASVQPASRECSTEASTVSVDHIQSGIHDLAGTFQASIQASTANSCSGNHNDNMDIIKQNGSVGATSSSSVNMNMRYKQGEGISTHVLGLGNNIYESTSNKMMGDPSAVAESKYDKEVEETSAATMANGKKTQPYQLPRGQINLFENNKLEKYSESWIDPLEHVEVVMETDDETGVDSKQVEPLDLRKPKENFHVHWKRAMLLASTAEYNNDEQKPFMQ